MEPENDLMSMLSTRNIMRLLSNGIEEIRKYAVDPILPSQDNVNYLTLIQSLGEDYERYVRCKQKLEHQSANQRNEDLKMELKVSRIPVQFFKSIEQYPLTLSRRSEATRRQQQLEEYLDEIEVVIFSKAAKYPARSFIILENLSDTSINIDLALKNVNQTRIIFKEKVGMLLAKQKRINRVNRRITQLKELIITIQVCKVIRDLKVAASADSGNTDSQRLLLIRKKDLEKCEKILSLRRIVLNVESYRSSIKENLYTQFQSQMERLFGQLLQYSKQDWSGIHSASGKVLDVSMNITVLDQSYFGFDTQHLNIVDARQPQAKKEAAYSSAQYSAETLDLRKIFQLWGTIKRFDIYDESEVNQNLIRLFVKHNNLFNQDMNSYLSQVYDNIQKSTSKGQSYASFKKNQQSTLVKEVVNRVGLVQMRLYTKIVTFYFDMFKRVLQVINSNTSLQFLANFKGKLYEFIESRVAYFLSLKKPTHETTVDDFVIYLNMIQYWLLEEEYGLHAPLQTMFQKTIQEYITELQRNLLVKELKEAIEESSFLPHSLSSKSYMSFHFIVNGSYENAGDDHDLSLSMAVTSERKDITAIRFIDTKILLRGKEYRICEMFLILVASTEKYLQLKSLLTDFGDDIDEKICDLVGFYGWYGHKVLISTKGPQRSLRNLSTFLSNLLLLREIFQGLGLKGKKFDKTLSQITECQGQVCKLITMTPFMMLEEKISQMYENKQFSKVAPSAQSARILEIMKQTTDSLKEIFPLDCQPSLKDSMIARILQTCMKLLQKNYFGYLLNMERRGVAELRWFLPKLKDILEVTVFGSAKDSNASSIQCLFNVEIEEMQRQLRLKGK